MTHATEREWKIAKVQTSYDRLSRLYEKALDIEDYESADYYLDRMGKCDYRLMELKLTHNGAFVND